MQKTLIYEYEKSCGMSDNHRPDRSVSPATFGRFIRGEENRGIDDNGSKAKKIKKEFFWAGLWTFLHNSDKYKVFFDATPATARVRGATAKSSKPKEQTVEAAFSAALERFLQTEKNFTHTTRETIRAEYAGKFVMYRADLRPYATKVQTPERFRATSLEIEAAIGATKIVEIQDLPKIGNQEELSMTIRGIMFSYGRFPMFIMHADGKESFRLGVIRDTYTRTSGVQAYLFRGIILVASEADLFPSTKFVCIRDDGSLKTGRIGLRRVPLASARAYLADAHQIARAHYGLDKQGHKL